MKKLFLYFTNEAKQSTTIIVQQPNQQLEPEVVRRFMEQVVALKLFTHKGQLKYAHIKGAKYVDKQTEILWQAVD